MLFLLSWNDVGFAFAGTDFIALIVGDLGAIATDKTRCDSGTENYDKRSK